MSKFYSLLLLHGFIVLFPGGEGEGGGGKLVGSFHTDATIFLINWDTSVRPNSKPKQLSDQCNVTHRPIDWFVLWLKCPKLNGAWRPRWRLVDGNPGEKYILHNLLQPTLLLIFNSQVQDAKYTEAVAEKVSLAKCRLIRNSASMINQNSFTFVRSGNLLLWSKHFYNIQRGFMNYVSRSHWIAIVQIVTISHVPKHCS